MGAPNEAAPGIEFREWPKIARWDRPVVITEKIDGTNACVIVVEDDGYGGSTDGLIVAAQSRSRVITPKQDNHGFAQWVREHEEELKLLGPGYHYGEWWGSGIQRRYGLDHKRFSLFNVDRWSDEADPPRPPCCHVVPVLWRGPMGEASDAVDLSLRILRERGSFAAPGFMNPEGVVVFHYAGRTSFKRTLEKDDMPKALAA
jgi:hypothetical protein